MNIAIIEIFIEVPLKARNRIQSKYDIIEHTLSAREVSVSKRNLSFHVPCNTVNNVKILDPSKSPLTKG